MLYTKFFLYPNGYGGNSVYADLTIVQFTLYGIPVLYTEFFLYLNGYGVYSGYGVYGRFDNNAIQSLWDPCVIHQVLSLS